MFKSPYTFLSTKPQKRLLSRSHPEQLAVLPHIDITTPSLVAVITATDGTVSSHILLPTLTLRAGEAKSFEIGFPMYGYDALIPEKKIRHITVRIESPDFENGTADQLIYYPYTAKGDNVIALYYHNSYGGVDSLICIGNHHSVETEATLVVKDPLAHGYISSNEQYTNVNQQFTTIMQNETGAKPTNELLALQDFFTLKEAYEYRNDLVIKILPQGNGVTFPSNMNNIKKVSFSYRYAYDQKAINRLGT